MPRAMFVWLYQEVQFNIINSTNIYKKKYIKKSINLKTSITQRPSSVHFKIKCRIYYHKLLTLQGYQVLIGLKAVCEFFTCKCTHALLNSILFKLYSHLYTKVNSGCLVNKLHCTWWTVGKKQRLFFGT